MSEQIGEECGVGLIVHTKSSQTDSVTPDACELAKQQEPRGQCGYGIGGLTQGKFWTHKELVTATNSEEIDQLSSYRHSTAAIVHNRYATMRGRCKAALHPVEIFDEDPFLHILFALNGHIQNLEPGLAVLAKHGVKPKMKTDTFVIANLLHLFTKLHGDYTKALREMAPYLDGAFNCTALNRQGTGIAFRDTQGIRPLFYGTAPKRGISFVASEDSYARNAFQRVNGDHCDISPLPAGNVLYLRPDEELKKEEFAVSSMISHCRQKTARCIFEGAYTEDWQSKNDDDSIARGRYGSGISLSVSKREWIAQLRESGEIEQFVVIPVPNTAKLAGRAVADESGIPLLELIQKKRVEGIPVKRTFIEPPSVRKKKAKEKYIFMKPPQGKKKCLLVEDSIVRATTIPVIVKQLRAQGFEEIHLLIGFPGVIGPCFYGIDMKDFDELFARNFFTDKQLDAEYLPPEVLQKMAKALGVDSLSYLSTKDAPKLLGDIDENTCQGCTRGIYPTVGGQQLYNLKYEKFTAYKEKEQKRKNKRKGAKA